MKKISLMISAFSCFILLNTGCSNKHDPEEAAKDTNEEKFEGSAENDAKFVVDATTANLFEIKAAELAKSKATTTDAKNLADMMFEAHSKANADLGALAGQKAITVPTTLPSDKQDEINNLDKETGMDFDKKYAGMMEDKHEGAVKMFEDASKDCNDADIKNWASNTLPELRHHLEMSKSCKEALDKMK